MLERRTAEVKAHTFTPDRQRLDFAGLCGLFIASKVKARATTLEGYAELIDCYLRPYFGPRKVETITRFHVEAFRNEMAAGLPATVRRAREALQVENRMVRDLKPGARTTNKCLTLLVGILGYAVRHGFASRNAAELMDKLPIAEGESRAVEQNVLAPAELDAIFAAAVDPYRVPIMLAAFTGARQAEVLGLKWGDIDWNRRTAEISRTWRRGAFYAPKTASSRRPIELPDELVSELRRWRLACPKGEHDLICPTRNGTPMCGSDLLRLGFQAALRRAGVRQVRFHDLRHSCASNLLRAGVDVVRVSKALGHANVHITLTTYAHAIPNERQGVADAMTRLMRRDGNSLETSGVRAAG